MRNLAAKSAMMLLATIVCASFTPAITQAATCDPKELLVKNFNFDRMDINSALAYKNASSEEWSSDTSKKMAGTFGYGAYSGGFSKDSATRVQRLIQNETSLDSSLQLNTVTASNYLSKEGLDAYKSCLAADAINIFLEDPASQDPINSREFTIVVDYTGLTGSPDNVTYALRVSNGFPEVTGPNGLLLQPQSDGKTYLFRMHIKDKKSIRIVGRKRQASTLITLNGVDYGTYGSSITVPRAAPSVDLSIKPVEGEVIQVRTVGKCVGSCNPNIPPVPLATSCVQSETGGLLDGTEKFAPGEVAGDYTRVSETKDVRLAGYEVCFILQSDPRQYAVKSGKATAYEFKKPIVTYINDPDYVP